MFWLYYFCNIVFLVEYLLSGDTTKVTNTNNLEKTNNSATIFENNSTTEATTNNVTKPEKNNRLISISNHT